MDLIGELLREGLLGQLGDDQERAAKLRAASKTLADQLIGTDVARRMFPVVFVEALDPSPESSALEMAERALIAEWETYRNVYPDRPVALLQALLLAAVAHAASRRKAVKQAGWYTLRTATEEVSRDFWAGPLKALYREWDADVAAAIKDSWAPELASARVKMPSVGEPVAPSVDSDVPDRLQQRLVDAGGATSPGMTALIETMPGYLRELVDAAEQGAGDAVQVSAKQLRTVIDALGRNLREVLATHEQGVKATAHRLNLLWWHQSGYSPRLDSTYRSLGSSADVVLAAALDLHLDVPDLTPVAGEHLLAELVARHAAEAQVAVEELATCSQAAAIDERYAEGRGPILSSILGLQVEGMAFDQQEKLTVGRAAILVFRDLQAARLLGARQPAAGE